MSPKPLIAKHVTEPQDSGLVMFSNDVFELRGIRLGALNNGSTVVSSKKVAKLADLSVYSQGGYTS
jgi:hypothetical protein